MKRGNNYKKTIDILIIAQIVIGVLSIIIPIAILVVIALNAPELWQFILRLIADVSTAARGGT